MRLEENYIRWRDWTTKNKCPFLLTFKCFYYSGWQKAVWPKRRPFCPIPVHPSLPAAAAGRSHVSYDIFISCPNDEGRLCSCERARWWNVPRRLKKKEKKSTVTSSPPCHADRRYTQDVGGAWASAWANGNQTPAEAPSSCQASGVGFITRILPLLWQKLVQQPSHVDEKGSVEVGYNEESAFGHPFRFPVNFRLNRSS